MADRIKGLDSSSLGASGRGSPIEQIRASTAVSSATSAPQPSVDSVMLMVAAGAPPAIIGSAKVRQLVTRGPEGWRISRRTMVTGTA